MDTIMCLQIWSLRLYVVQNVQLSHAAVSCVSSRPARDGALVPVVCLDFCTSVWIRRYVCRRLFSSLLAARMNIKELNKASFVLPDLNQS